MAGRHRAASDADNQAVRDHSHRTQRRRTKPRRVRLLASVAAGGLLAAGAVIELEPQLHNASARAHCSGALPVPILAAPSISHAIAAVVGEWQRTEPSVSGTCLKVTVTSQNSYAAERNLVRSSRATVWIPESSVWRSRLLADVPSLAPLVSEGQSVATSPLVIATTPGHASSVAAVAKSGWWAQLAGATSVAITDPMRNAEAALALVGYSTALGTSSKAANTFAGTALRLAADVVPTPAKGFANLKANPATAKPFVTTEQQVIRANKSAVYPIAVAVYPSGAGLALDYPVIAITPATDPAFGEAVDVLTARLRDVSGQHQLGVIGLRDPSGVPIADTAATGSDRPVAPTVRTSARRLGDVLQVWIAARRPTALLAAIDVSGSMKEDAGNGRRKIDIAADAATAAMRLFPNQWSAALWTFASTRPQPWTQLVPLGSLGAQRAALQTATQSLPVRVGGNTALYATTWAAFSYLSAHYAPDKVDAVVLMTDGSNTDPSLSLGTLLAELRRSFNRDRPVHITTIALGKDADVAALRQISAVTDGRTFVVSHPQDLSTGLLQSVLGAS